MTKLTEAQAKKIVKNQKKFLQHFSSYIFVNTIMFLLWALGGGGYFWPVWAIIPWGIGLGWHAYMLGLIPNVGNFLPFLNDNWESEQVRKLMKNPGSAPASNPGPAAAKKAPAKKKPAAKKKAAPKKKK